MSKQSNLARARIYDAARRALDPDRKKRWERANPEKIKAYSASYYRTHRAKLIKKAKDYAAQNRHKINAWERQYRKRNTSAAIAKSLRNRLNEVLKRGRSKSTGSALSLLGCSLEDFRIYLETKFEPGMTWDNRGDWEVDHIMPCAIFDLTKADHQRRCFHFSNMQPLWRTQNRRKNKRPTTDQFQLL